MSRIRLFVAASAAALAAAGAATAQPASQTPPPASPGPSSTSAASSSGTAAAASPSPGEPAPATSLSEVVVTAQRQSENLQRAAVSVTAVSGTDLVRNAVTDPLTLPSVAPGLAVVSSGGGLVSYFVRGVGNFSESPTGNPAIAFNLDDVYIGRPVASTGPFFDLDRVEVLKGPQGTLYGRNATAGAINVIPTKPKLDSFGGYVNASYGNYDAYNVEAAVNAPIGDATAVRLSANFAGHDGYLSDGTSDQDTKAVRLQVLTTLVPQLTARFVFDYADLGGVGGGSNYQDAFAYNPATNSFSTRFAGLSPRTGLFDPRSQAFLQTTTATPAGRTSGPLAAYPFVNNKLWGVHGEFTYDTGFGTLTFIPSWRPSSIATRSSLPSFTYQLNEKDDDYSTELRFAGKRVGIFDYTLGFFYFRETEDTAFSANGQSTQNFQNSRSTIDSYAGFGRVTAHLTDRLRLVGGVRYTVDDLGFNASAVGLTRLCVAPACPGSLLFPFSPTLATQPVPYPPGPGVLPVGPGALVLRSGEVVASTQSTSRATGRAAVEYDLTSRSLLYFSYESGYRAGGFNVATGFETYAPEDIDAYTWGSKNRLFDNRLELNLEAFVWKYTNQQVSHIATDLAGNLANITQNIGRSTNQGVEVEGRYLLTPDTVLNANLQYLDATYDSFVYQTPLQGGVLYSGCRVTPAPGNPANFQIDCSGKRAFNAPRYTLDLGVEQTVRIGRYKIVGNINTQYLSSRYIGFDYTLDERTKDNWHTNAQITVSPDNAPWTVALFMQNIENTRFPTEVVNNPFSSVLVTTTAPPRTYGVRVSTRF